MTKHRRDSLALIDKGERQPLHIDHDIWERLKKLAASRQQTEKSEQGKRANMARKSFGRTGSRWVNGVRELLREKFNRSPDPDEMESELTRDKGYGGYKKKRALVKLEKEFREQSSEENRIESPSKSPLAEEHINDGGLAAGQKVPHRQKHTVTFIWQFCK